jgi:hypothetical protein
MAGPAASAVLRRLPGVEAWTADSDGLRPLTT